MKPENTSFLKFALSGANRSALQIVVGLIFVGLLVWFLPRLDWLELWHALKDASKTSMLLALGAVVAYWLSRSLILWTVLRAKENVRYRDSLLAIILGMSTDQMIPGRVGYLVRFGVLWQRCQLAKSLIVVSLLVVVVMEALGLLSLLLVSLLWDSSSLSSTGLSWPAVGGLVLGLAGFFVFLQFLPRVGPRLPEKWRPSFLALSGFIQSSRHVRHWGAWAGSSLLMWIFQLMIVLFSAKTFGVELTFTEGVLLLAAINLATLVPIVPGNIGSMQVVCTTVLASFGVSTTTGFAISLVYHFLHLAPLLLVGALCSMSYGLSWQSVAETASEERSAA